MTKSSIKYKSIPLDAVLKSLSANTRIKRLNMRKSQLLAKYKSLKPIKDEFIHMRSLWNKDSVCVWVNADDDKEFPELTAVFDSDVIFFMHADHRAMIRNEALRSMKIISGRVADVIEAMHPTSKTRMYLELESGHYDFGRKWLTSYQEISNYLVSKKTVHHKQRVLNNSPDIQDWKKDLNDGRNLALSKAQAAELCNKLNVRRTCTVTLYTDGRVIFFANSRDNQVLPSEFVDIIWSKPGTVDEIMEQNDCHGKFLFTTKNVNEYLNAHYPCITSNE